MWNTKGRGVLRNTPWEMLVCWPKPNLLLLEAKVLHRVAQANLSSCCSGHFTNVQKVPAKKKLQLLPVPAAALCLCLPPTHPPARLALFVYPRPPSSRPNPNVTPPQAFLSEDGMGDLSASSCPTTTNLAGFRSF